MLLLASRTGIMIVALAAVASLTPAQAAPRRSAAPTYPEKPKDAPPTEEYEAQFPTKMTWNLTDVNGKPAPAEATLQIDDNLRGSGASGCNTWSASLYPVKGQRLAMGPIAQTKKACANDVLQFERTFLGILHSGPTWNQTGYTLTIKSQVGTLVFKRGL